VENTILQNVAGKEGTVMAMVDFVPHEDILYLSSCYGILSNEEAELAFFCFGCVSWFLSQKKTALHHIGHVFV